jgi:hypothetical protein
LLAIPVLDAFAAMATPYMDALGPLGSFQLIRVRHLVPFAVAANVAIALATLAANWDRLPRGRIVIGAALLGVAIAALQLAVSVGRLIGQSAPAAGWSAAVAALSLGLLALIALTLGARALTRVRGSRLPPLLAVAFVLIMIGERAAFARAERLLFGQGLGTWSAHMTVDPGMEFLRYRVGTADRVLTVGLPVAGAHPNAMSLAGLRDAGGYQTTYSLAYHAFFGVMTGPFLADNPDLWRYFHGWGNRAYAFGDGFDPEVLDLAGIRWIYAEGLDLDEPDMVKRYQFGRVTVYENLDPFPRAFAVGGTRAFASAGELEGALAEASREELGTSAFVLADARPRLTPDGDWPLREATVIEYDDDRVRIRVDVPGPAMLVLTDSWDAGWAATVDGDPAEIIRAYHTFRAVRIPAGASDVVFAYKPTETLIGFALTGGAVFGLTAWTGLALVDRRRLQSTR